MIIILLFIFTNLASSDEYYRVFYKDKDTLNFVAGNPYYENTLSLFNNKALERRFLHQKEITIEDAIIKPEYISTLKNHNLEIINSSRWFNYSVVKASDEVIEELLDYDFILKISKTNSKFEPQSINEINYTELILDKNSYGDSENQVKMLNVDFFHSMGFNGDSVVIGYLDTGYKLHPEIFDSTQLIAQYDFINNNDETANQSYDTFFQDFHGTSVLSTVSGYFQDSLIGIASETKFILAKTEDLPSEKNIEEDFYLFGVEWMESQGAEILNSSLGYKSFDSLQYSYSFDELDGSTTLVSKAVNKAVEKGILFFTAMGNYGQDGNTIISPADADSVIAVGALEPDGQTIAAFSSAGPNANGDIRPHILTQGHRVRVISNLSGTFHIFNSGTSFASPIAAGCGALIKSIYNLPNYEIKENLIKNADNFNTPSNTFGYGKIDVRKSIDELSKSYGPAISPYNIFEVNGKMRVVFYVYGYDDDYSVYLRYKSSDRGMETEIEMQNGVENYQFFSDLPESEFVDNQIFINLEVRYKGKSKYYRDDFVKILYGNEIIRKGVDKFSLPTLVNNNQEDIIVYLSDSDLIIENNSKKIEDFEINILDISGKSLFLYSILLRNGKNVLNLQRNLSTGLYLVNLKSESTFVTRKIIYTNSGS